MVGSQKTNTTSETLRDTHHLLMAQRTKNQDNETKDDGTWTQKDQIYKMRTTSTINEDQGEAIFKATEQISQLRGLNELELVQLKSLNTYETCSLKNDTIHKTTIRIVKCQLETFSSLS